MIDWNGCPVVVSRHGFLSGQPGLLLDPRVPPQTIVDNLDAGESAQDVITNFGLKTSLQDVLAVYAYAQAHARYS